MAGNKKFAKVMAQMAAEVLAATGLNARGEHVGRPRFPHFNLTGDIKTKLRSALSIYSDGREDDAVEMVEEAAEHLRRKQVIYLRNYVIPAVSRLMTETVMPLHLGNRVIDPIYSRVASLNETSESREVDLAQASLLFWDITNMVAIAQEKHEAERIENARQEADRLRQKEDEARKARVDALQAEANRLAEQYAGLLVA